MTSLDDGVSTLNTTIVTITTTVNNAVTEVVHNTTFTRDVTEDSVTTRMNLTMNVTVNVTGDASGRATAWGECEPWVADVGLQCYNCLWIPSMSNFTVCVDTNTVTNTPQHLQ